MTCACGSNTDFKNCCEPFINGTQLPDTAEKLMRSRYTAYTLGKIEYIQKTLAPESQKDFDLKASKEWAANSTWKGLKIMSVTKGLSTDTKGTVEFTATYTQDGTTLDHHEVSEFRKDGSGKWFFVDGHAHTHEEGQGHHHHHKQETVVREGPKIGRNDPCNCGSGKKYKKCHGANV